LVEYLFWKTLVKMTGVMGLQLQELQHLVILGINLEQATN